MTTYKPFIERMDLALAVLTDAKAQLPAGAVGLRSTIDGMITHGEQTYGVFDPRNTAPLDARVFSYQARPKGEPVKGKDLSIFELAGWEGGEAGTRAWIARLSEPAKARVDTLLERLQEIADLTGKQQAGPAMIEGRPMRYVACPSTAADAGVHLVHEQWFQEFMAKVEARRM